MTVSEKAQIASLEISEMVAQNLEVSYFSRVNHSTCMQKNS